MALQMTNPRRIVSAVSLTILALGLGCSTPADRGLTPRRITLSDLVREVSPESASGEIAPDSENPSAGDPNQAAAVPPLRAVGPTEYGTPSLRPGDSVIVDGVIGQVSGRPIFADELLDPISDQLQRERERLASREFAERAGVIVNTQLNEVVLNELFLAEAEATLTEQEQLGLLALLRDLQEQTVARGAGSRIRTEERLQEESGLTLEELTERQRSQVLITKLLREKIEPRVIVSWKDVQREYERRRDEFNPTATVTLKRLRLSNTDQNELIEDVKKRLASGEHFEDVFDSLGPPDATVLDPLKMGDGGLSDLPINEAYKPYLAKLSGVGHTTEPIQLENRTVWLHVAAIDQPPARSLYDVQRKLLEELTVRRRNEQYERYVSSLFEKGIYDELDEMSRRLVTIAVTRHAR